MNTMNKTTLLFLTLLFPLLSSAQSLAWNDTMMVWFEARPPVHLTNFNQADNLYFVSGKTGDLVAQFGMTGLNESLGGMSIDELKSMNAFFGTNAPIAIFADKGLNLWAGTSAQVRRLNPQVMPRRVIDALIGEPTKLAILVFTAGTRREYLYDQTTGQFSTF